MGQKNKRQRADGRGEEERKGDWLRGGIKSAPALDEDKKKKRRNELRRGDGVADEER